MRNRLKIFTAFLALSLGMGACTDAADEINDVNLGQLLRPSAVTAVVQNSESIVVSWRATADEFTLEYTKDADFAADITSIEHITTNKQVVTELDEATTYYFRVKSLTKKQGVLASEYSAVASARTLLEPRIPNVKATSEMTYTLSPWEITCTVTMTWGDESLDPEALTAIRATPAAGGEALTFDLTAEEALAQQKIFSEGILTDTEYTFDLIRGTKVRGTCTHRTVPGPIPAVHATAELDFTTQPVSAKATFTWDLYYVPTSDLAKIVLTVKGAVTPEQEVAFTPADITAGHLKALGLTPGTDYVAALVATDARIVASVEFSTPAAPSREVIIVNPGDDLGAIISADDRALDTVYLMPGAYTISDVSPTIKRNLVLTSDDPTKTTVTMGMAFRGQGTFEKMVFRNIKFVCSTYLLQISKSDYNIDLYRIENCVVDLNSGSSANSTLFSSAGTASEVTRQKVGRYEVLNSTVYANAAQTQSLVYMAASGSVGEFGKILVRNSTFSNTGRGLITSPSTADYAFDVEFDGCTLYNMCAGGTTALIDIRMQGLTNSSKRFVTFRNTVIWHGSAKGYKLLQFAGSTEGMFVPPTQITSSNFYYFSSQKPTFGNAAYSIDDNLMTSYAGLPADLWANPAADPTAAGVSFRIKDQSVLAAQQAAGTTLGDQRWK